MSRRTSGWDHWRRKGVNGPVKRSSFIKNKRIYIFFGKNYSFWSLFSEVKWSEVKSLNFATFFLHAFGKHQLTAPARVDWRFCLDQNASKSAKSLAFLVLCTQNCDFVHKPLEKLQNIQRIETLQCKCYIFLNHGLLSPATDTKESKLCHCYSLYLSFVDNFDGNFFFAGDGVSFPHACIGSLAYFLSDLISVAPQQSALI